MTTFLHWMAEGWADLLDVDVDALLALWVEQASKVVDL